MVWLPGFGLPRLRPVRALALRTDRRLVEGAWNPGVTAAQTRLNRDGGVRHEDSYTLVIKVSQESFTVLYP